MKIKDLKDNTNLLNIKVKTSKGKVGYYKSQWYGGIWLSDGKTNRIYPQFVQNLSEVLEWDIIDEETEINL